MSAIDVAFLLTVMLNGLLVVSIISYARHLALRLLEMPGRHGFTNTGEGAAARVDVSLTPLLRSDA